MNEPKEEMRESPKNEHEGMGEDIIGLDANVLVDMAESQEFKEEIEANVRVNVLKITTTSVALGEAKQTLIKKRSYAPEKAVEALKKVMSDFNIRIVQHKREFDEAGEEWVGKIKQQMFIKKFSTFPNDCKIIANLLYQEKINIYITEDVDIKKAVKLLALPLRVLIVGEAEYMNERKIKEFFRENRKAHGRKHKP